MQIKTEEIKKTKKFLSFNNFKASKPKIPEIETVSSLFILGGVFGKKKLKTPKTTDTIAVIKKVFCNIPAAAFSLDALFLFLQEVYCFGTESVIFLNQTHDIWQNPIIYFKSGNI